MTDANADASPANATARSSLTLRLRRGWLAFCTRQNYLTAFCRERIQQCCFNGERFWFLSEGKALVAAVFGKANAQRIRDAVNGYAALLQVNELSARCCEEHPQSVEVGLFIGEEFTHSIELERSLAIELLFALLESLEESMQTSPMNRDEVDRQFRRRVTERSLRHWRQADASLTTHPILQELRRQAPLSLTLEWLLRDQCYGRTPDAFVGNLLVGLRHFCDAYGLDLGALDRRAYQDYLMERHSEASRREETVSGGTQPQLNVAHEMWTDISEGRDRSVLMTTVLIGGVSHHLKATQVEMRNSVQAPVDPACEEELTDVHARCGANGPFETVSLEGRDYVLTLTPHSR